MGEPSAAEQTVFVVDDDEAMRSSLAWLIESMGLQVRTFPDADHFLSGYDPAAPGCLVLDVRMPGISGLELQERLRDKGVRVPIIFISAHGDVAMAMRAVKNGALDFLEKPCNHDEMATAIHTALQRDREQRTAARSVDAARARLTGLTPREQEILQLVVEGLSSRAIGDQLGISSRTVEVHRARLMDKTGAESVPDLVRMVLDAARDT